MRGLYTRTLNTFAAGACTVAALAHAANGNAWWALITTALAAHNVWLASRTTIHLHPAPAGRNA